MTQEYRSDIDGLRAIAVTAVVLYHLELDAFSGGFVGVDVFFVISGFLITTIIARELRDGTFSVAKFYERRFRRILPAAWLMVVCTLIVGHLLLNARDYASLAASAAANSVFMSNVYFHSQEGYFAVGDELKPLLHTWSLSVEEQFYLFFPLLMLLIFSWGWKRNSLWLLGIVTLSLAACIYWTERDQSAAFFMLPTRAWQLLTGSVLAVSRFQTTSRSMQSIGSGLAVLGLTLIVVSIFSYSAATSFPGVAATIPTAGAALVIQAGSMGSNIVSRVLSVRPLTFIGLISYSLYLWHWPVIVYAKYLKVVDLSTMELLAVVALILLLATLSWRYVEAPFRDKSVLSSRRSVFVASAASTSVLLAVAVAVSLNDGFPNRHDATLSAEELAGDPEWKSLIECQRMPIGSGLCVLGKEGVVPSFILWGDSHARSLASGMSIVARQHGIAGIIASKDACPPLLGIDRRGRHDCREFNDQVLQFLSRSPSVSTVILHGRWALSAQGTRYKRESGESVALSDGSRTSESAGRDNVELFELGLRRTVESLQDMRKTVIVVAGIPEVGRDVPAALHAASVTRRDPNLLIAPSVDEFLLRNGQVFKVMSSIQQSTGIRIITPSELLCSSGRCKVASEAGVALYRDDHHLSTHGSRYVAQTLHEIFN